MSVEFKKENRWGQYLETWWQGLEDDRASRAILRRANTILDISLSPPYQRLYSVLCKMGWKDERNLEYDDRLALLIGVLAHVKHHDENKRPANAMSQLDGDKPLVSELRFRRLLDAPDNGSLFMGLRRVLPLLGEQGLDILQLANDILYWGDKVKKEWAYSYVWPEKKSQ